MALSSQTHPRRKLRREKTWTFQLFPPMPEIQLGAQLGIFMQTYSDQCVCFVSLNLKYYKLLKILGNGILYIWPESLSVLLRAFICGFCWMPLVIWQYRRFLSFSFSISFPLFFHCLSDVHCGCTSGDNVCDLCFFRRSSFAMSSLYIVSNFLIERQWNKEATYSWFTEFVQSKLFRAVRFGSVSRNRCLVKLSVG